MWWFIFGAIAFLVTLLIWKNTYTDRRYDSRAHGYVYTDKLRLPLWAFLLLIAGFFTPILNIITTVIMIIVLIVNLREKDIYIHFKSNSILSKIGSFFNKNIFKDK
jgi:hypothetical protein